MTESKSVEWPTLFQIKFYTDVLNVSGLQQIS